jgi:hypothetical protein
MRASVATVLLSLALGACANFDAVSGFASETSQLTRAAKNEFTQLDTLCTRQAEIVIVANRIADDGPLKDCRGHKAAHGRLADTTVAVLDDFAKALAALAQNRSFDLSKDVKAVGKQLAALKDKDGQPLVGKRETTALVRIAEVLAGVAASREREAAVRRLAEEKDNLAICAAVLRSYFVAPAGASARAPHANLVALAGAQVDSTQRLLRGPALRGAEPIRSYELERELEAHRRAIARRAGPGGVAPAMAAAIDAWLLALDRFAVEALSRDPKLLYERLADLHDKIAAAEDALQALDP